MTAVRDSSFTAALELTAALFVPPHNPATILLGSLVQTLRERSGGRLGLRVFDSEKLGKTAEQYDLARSGGADIAYMIHSATPGRFPLTELAALPPVTGAVAGTAALQALLPTDLAAEHAGVEVLFLAANTPMAIHSLRPLASLADLRGLRVGHTGRVVAGTLAALGAEPVTVFPLDIRAALARGEIDATSMTYEAAQVIGLAEVVRCSYELDANTITFGLVMNPARLAMLPEDLRQVVRDVLGARAGSELARALAACAESGAARMREAGVAIVRPDDAERRTLAATLRSVSETFVAGLEQQGLPARRVFETLKAGLGPAGGA